MSTSSRSRRPVEPASSGHTSAPLVPLGVVGVATVAAVAVSLWGITVGVRMWRSGASAQVSTDAQRMAESPRHPGAPLSAKRPRPPARPLAPGEIWPKGAKAAEFALIATNIPPGDPARATAVLLEDGSDRYVVLSTGDKVGDFEVANISLDWVQLRRGGTSSWVGYGERRKRRRARGSAPSTARPRRVKRRWVKGPSVTRKWLIGRLNLAGELEEHLQPKTTAKGVSVGRITTGFRRIGVRVGDVIHRAGNRRVRTLYDIKEGLQRAAQTGGSSAITVLRKGREIELKFNVR